MKRLHLTSILALLAATLAPANAGAQTRPSEPPAPARRSQDFSERYAVLADKNIFVRNRPPTRRGSSGQSAPARPEAMHVLTGITLQEGRHVAFIENTGTRSTQRLLPGESVAGGKVIGVTFDELEFEINGQRVKVRVGRNLLGDVATAPPPPAAPAVAATGSNGAATAPAGAPPSANADAGPPPPPLPGDPSMSPEERLRLRRQQQMGGSGR